MAGLRLFLVLVWAASGCRTNHSRQADQVTPGLSSSVAVEVGASDVRLEFHISNTSNQPVVLEFNSGQRYDFAVRTTAGAEVWRWSADQMFTQALGTETIPGGGTVQYSAVWPSGDRTGAFTAVAELKATNYPLEQRTNFERRPR